jgi:hypothetical protein
MTQLVRALEFHASYRCEHSGVCCTSGWPIVVEREHRERLGPLLAPAPTAGLSAAADVADDDRLLLPIVDGACGLYDCAGRRCRAHAALGHAALPLACRQFPRVTVSDPRGVSVTLSHVCPTARRHLTSGAIAIVTDAIGFPADGEYVGLDARDALPPLLRADMLMDWESWWEWETRSVAVIAAREAQPAEALGILAAATRDICRWSPSDGLLRGAIDSAFVGAVHEPDEWRPDDAGRAAWVREAYARIPKELQSQAPVLPVGGRSGKTAPSVLARYLAAHAFANWAVHVGDGLRAWFHSLEVAFVLAETVGVGDADLVLRHLSQ